MRQVEEAVFIFIEQVDTIFEGFKNDMNKLLVFSQHLYARTKRFEGPRVENVACWPMFGSSFGAYIQNIARRVSDSDGICGPRGGDGGHCG